jgi:hypothetical protein
MGVCQLADVGECLLQVGQHPLPEGVVGDRLAVPLRLGDSD